MAPKQKRSESTEGIKQPVINYTLCIPTTIISQSNAKNLQQITSILYQIAKVASIYNVAEIVVMDTLKPPVEEPVNIVTETNDGKTKKIKFDDTVDIKKQQVEKNSDQVTEQAMIIATLLQYFVTPPYLVNTIFKKKFLTNFQYAKTYPKLTKLPFMEPQVSSKYREGLTVQMGKVHKPQGPAKKKSQPLKNTKYVNIGHDKYLELVGQQVPTNVRVTVDTETKKVVSPLEAYSQSGAKSSYGYHVRIAKQFSSIFTESSYPEGYTMSAYVNSGDYFHHGDSNLRDLKIVKSKNQNILLIVAKWSDLEYSFHNDKKNLEGVQSVKELFDGEVKIPLGTRVEDGSLIALTRLESLYS